MRAIDRLIKFLTANFNKDNEIFKAVIGDENGVAVNPAGYINGTSGSLTNPDDDYSQTNGFVPIVDVTNEVRLWVGGYPWLASGVGVGDAKVYSGGSSGVGVWGEVSFQPQGGFGPNWDSFASINYDGWKILELPRLADNDGLGGPIGYYYSHDLWKAKLEGTAHKVVLAIDGSVYANSIAPENLINNPEGKNYTTVNTSADYNQGAIANELEWFLDMIAQTKESANLNDVSSIELEAWKDVTGIEKYVHESITFWTRKALAYIAGEKHTKYAIEQALFMFTDTVIILESSLDNGFTQVSYADSFDSFSTPQLVRGATVSGGVGFPALRIQVGNNAALSNLAVRRAMMQLLEHIILPGVKYDVELI